MLKNSVCKNGIGLRRLSHRLCQSSTGKYDPLQGLPRFAEGLEAPSKLARLVALAGQRFTDSPQGSIHIKHLEGVIFES